MNIQSVVKELNSSINFVLKELTIHSFPSHKGGVHIEIWNRSKNNPGVGIVNLTEEASKDKGIVLRNIKDLITKLL